jgi:hypothetical protein
MYSSHPMASSADKATGAEWTPFSEFERVTLSLFVEVEY